MIRESCIFCKIAIKDYPVSSIYEDADVIAFLDNRPASEGHTLIIPKRHAETIYDLSDKEIAQLFHTVKKVAVAIKKAIKPEGISIIQRNGAAAGQHIPHFHVHVIPRYSGQRLLSMEELQEENKELLDEVARKLKLHF